MRSSWVYFMVVVILMFGGGCSKNGPQSGGQTSKIDSATYTDSKIESMEKKLETINTKIAKKQYRLDKLVGSSESKALDKEQLRKEIRALEDERMLVVRELKYLKKIKSQE